MSKAGSAVARRRLDALVRRLGRRGGDAIEPRPATERERVVTSLAQDRLWWLERWRPGSAVYHLAGALELEGELDPAVLEAALEALARRHEALRTTFGETAGAPFQQIWCATPVLGQLVDLVALPDPYRARAAAAADGALARRAFDLARGPLWRAVLVRLGAARHRLIVVLHHLIADGISLEIFLAELAELYSAGRERRAPCLPVLAVQYGDWARWQRHQLAGTGMAERLAWWRRRLRGLPALELPVDRPRRGTEAGERHGGRVEFTLPAMAVRRLAALGRERSATLHQVYLAALAALLGRLCGQTDFALGAPLAERRGETENLVGFFVETVVLRLDLAGDPSFEALVERARQSALDAAAHAVPFARLVEEIRPERRLDATPFFQAMFSFAPARRPPSFGELSAALREIDTETAKFPLTLYLTHSEGGQNERGMTGSFEYDADFFDAATIERWAAHLGRFVGAAASAPERPALALPILSAGECHQLLQEWDGGAAATVVDDIAGETLDRAFARVAAKRGDAVAVSHGDQSLRYSILAERAAALAERLRKLGAGPEIVVGLEFERSLDLAVAILGVLGTGAAYLPLDPSLPEARRRFMLEDSGAAFVLRPGGVETLREVVPFRTARPSLDHLAYVIYTSGSTGRPKGTAITHRHVMRLFTATARSFDFGPDDVWTLFHSYAFDFSVWEMWGAWLNGGRLVIVEQDTARDPAAFLELLHAERVTVLNQTPSAFAQLADAENERAGRGLEPLELAVRQVIFGGEAVDLESLRPWLFLHAGPKLVNMYGITETTVHVTERPLVRADLDAAGRNPIGRALADLRLHVVDARLEPLPIGAAGEMAVGGAGPARGYLGRAGLTAERFVPDPWNAEPGARLYLSGDRARRLADGELEYLGRLDQQVQLRGFRVEPGEVAAALLGHPGVARAAVVARDDGDGARLVAYIVAAVVEEPAAEPGADELRRYLEGRLPEYMMPAAFVFLESLPLTTNGKLDRAALPAPADARADTAARFVAPETAVERRLAEIWRELLGAALVGESPIGKEDHFFRLGGHSLLATRLAARVRQDFGAEIELSQVFKAPRLADMAREIEARRAADSGPPIVARERAPGTPVPLSPAQRRLWLLERLEPGRATYVIPDLFALRGPIDEAALRTALAEIAARHEILRARFAMEGEEPVQIFAEVAPPPFLAVDLGRLAAPDAVAEALLRRAARSPFDLDRGPLLRAVLVLPSPSSEARLLLTLHHIVSDGWSQAILLDELLALYEAFAMRRVPRLPPSPVPYADWAAWQERRLGEALDDQLTWHRARLAEVPTLELPADRPRPAVRDGHGGQLVQPLGTAADRERLELLVRRSGATLYMTLLAAFGAWLGRLAGQDDFAIGTPFAGRPRPETQRTIGFFVNTLVLRSALPETRRDNGAASFAALLERVRDSVLAAFGRSEVPFERLVEELHEGARTSRPPLCQVSFLEQPKRPTRRAADLEIVPIEMSNGGAKFDLTLGFTTLAAGSTVGLAVGLEYDRQLFDETTARRFLDQFATLLAAAAASPERGVDELPLVSPAERHQTLVEWNDTDEPFAEGDPVHRLVGLQAARRPTALAVDDGETRLDYTTLVERSRRLAGVLRELGVGPELRVGILVERSASMVIAMLGVLEAGGAYVPFDPAVPAERLAYQLADAGAGVVVSSVALRPRLAETGARVLTVEETRQAPLATDLASFDPSAELDRLAYVIYTSGSTGRPKGTLLGHRGLLNLVAWNCRYFGYRPADRALQLANPSFDAAVAEIWPPLVTGASLHLAPAEIVAAARPLMRFLAERRISIGFMPTPLAEAVFDELGRAEELPDLHLRTLLVAGDRLHAPPPRGLPFAVVNLYGPTEATVATSAALTRPGDPRMPAVGRPIANLGVLLMDRRARLVPLGAAGELTIAGRGLARGYHRQPALTAVKFIPHPLTPALGARLYRSGDLARWRSDGELEFLGRGDHQVKVRGFRVELGEIEAALREQAAVEEALVAPQSRPGEPAATRLVAWITWCAAADFADEAKRLDELRATLGRRLPDYMIPAVFVPLEALPLLPSGKIDRRALEREALPEWCGSAEHAAPKTPAEEVLAAIWAELLGLERVGRDDDFFALGGHSLLATRMASRVDDAFGVEMPLHRIFAAPRLTDQAREISELRPRPTGAPPTLPRLERPAPETWPDDGWLAGPASFSQERMWLLAQLGGSAYGSVSLIFLRGRLEPALLRRVFTELVRRHEVLRTTFTARDGLPWQIVAAPGKERALPLADLSALSETLARRELEHRLRRERGRTIDFERGPIFRTLLLRLGANEHVLFLTHHHIIYDGWSMAILVRELGELYRAFAARRNAVLPALPVQYPDYAAWQRQWLDSAPFAAALDSWRQWLEPARRARPIALDRARSNAVQSRADWLPFEVDEATEKALRFLARAEGATLFMLFTAALHVTLAHASGTSASVIGTSIANRQHGEVEDLVGFFVNTLPLAADLGDEPSFRVLLGRARKCALAAFEEQQVPFEKITAAMSGASGIATAGRSASRAPLFQTMLAFQNVEEARLELPGLRLEMPAETIEGERAALFDLTFTIHEHGRLTGVLEYDAALFERQTAVELVELLSRVLTGAAADPERSIRDLPALSEAEKKRWRERVTPVPREEVEESEEQREQRLKAKVASKRSRLSSAKKALLARRLKGKKGRAKTTEKPADTISRRPAGEPVPLSWSQERLWFLDRLEPGSSTYHIPLPTRLLGRLEVPAVAAALDELCRRHEILRTRYEAPDGVPRQVVEAPRRRPLPLIDVSALPGERAAAEGRRQLREQLRRPFDLERGPILRAVLLRIAAEDHVVASVVHHIALDGWSVGLLVGELSELYAAFAARQAPSLPELSIQYGDFAAWQRQWLRGAELERQISYWQERLGSAPPLLELPTDRPRPPVQTFHGATVRRRLADHLAVGLRGLARSSGATLFVVLLAAFKVLLWRLAGQNDVSVGTPIAGRQKKELEGLLGMFLNTLVLRTEVDPALDYRQWIGRVRETALGAYAHQDVPFEKLLEVLQPERDLSRTPLFQVFFNMLNLPATEMKRSDLSIGLLEGSHVEAKFDLTVYVSDRPQGLEMNWVYNSDLFDAGRIEEMLAQFEGLLRQAVEDPDRPLARLALAGPAARQGLPEASEALDATWRGPVHEVFGALARAEPERLAVRDAEREWTYGELAADAANLAAELRRRGVARGEIVAVWAERRGGLVVALMGILEAGGAFLMLDPAYPPARHLACLEVAGARMMVKVAAEEVSEEILEKSELSILEALPRGPHPQPLSPRERGEEAQEICTAVEGPQDRLPLSLGERGLGGEGSGMSDISPEDLAYVAFTSGSTGVPKGILGRHGSLSHFIPWQRETFDFRPDDRYSLLSGLAHDPLHRDVLTPLQTGAAVVIPDSETFDAPRRLAAWLRDEGITIAHLTPAMAQILTEDDASEAPALRWAFLTGDALTTLDVERLRRLAPAVRVVNLYGATETQRAVGFFEVPATTRAGAAREVLPLGRGMRAVQLLVLDSFGRRTGIGEVGEIAVRSPHLSRGYRGLPKLTAERFVPLAGAATAGERVYRTGDLGRYRPDGVVTFAGRADQQVQVRGYRVELPEIEGALRRHPMVREAAVIQQRAAGDAPLVAFLVPNEAGEQASNRDLRAHLADRLPSYMVPAAFLWLERLPLTPNRKLDRAALRREAEKAEIGETSGVLVPPRTPTEEIMVELWREVLGRERVSVEDSFFELGGHSLLATRLLARVRQAFEVELPLRHLFAAPTVASLAAQVDASRGGPAMPELPTLTADREHLYELFPMTEVQEAYWVGRGGGLDLGGVATHSYQEFDLPNTFDVDRLEHAWRRLIERHDMLRAVIGSDGYQRILEDVPPFRIERLDLRGRPEEEVEAELLRLRRELSHQVLDASRWPLFDVRVTYHGDFVRLHVGRDLLIYDAFSGSIVQRELALFYRDPDLDLEPFAISFRDYVMAEVALKGSELHERALAYWRGRLDDLAPAPELPLARDPAILGRPTFERRGAGLDSAAWETVRRHAARAGLTPSAVLLTAYATALGTWSKSSRFTLNLTLFNRLPLHPQIDRLVGDFTSLTLLEVEILPGESFLERARRVQGRLWEDLDHRHVGGVWVQRELVRRRGGARGAVMPVVFTSTLGLNRVASAEGGMLGEDPGVSVGEGVGDGVDESAAESSQQQSGQGGGRVFGISQTPQVWLDHQVGEGPRGLGFNWDSVAGLFPDGLVDAMFAAYLELLAGLEEEDFWQRPEALLTPAAQLEVMTEANATAAPVPSGLLHEPFVARALEQPDEPAVITPERTLTHGELDRLSNQLARLLRRHGAHPNSLIAVLLEKCWEQAVAVFGVLKAGAAYLPIDPGLPEERVDYLLENGDVEIVLVRDHEASPRGPHPQPLSPRERGEEALESREAVQGPQEMLPLSLGERGSGGEGGSEGAGSRRFISVSDATLETEPETPLPDNPAQPTDLAYVIFTSGSTGQPKGVMIDHRGALNTCVDVNQRFQVVPDDRMLGLSALNFDLSVYDLFGVLGAGAALVLPRPEARRDPSHWVELVRLHGVTLWNTVPALMQMFVDFTASLTDPPPSTLRVVMMSGDWIPVTLPERIRELSPEAEVTSLGGATEASIWSILFPIEHVDPAWTSIPYGKAMVNQSFHVLDGALRPRPFWVPGELYIGGIGLAQGYWKDEARSAERFITHPEDGERLYRTGDLGRLLPSGDIEFLGREDFQVKIQGHRIELGEIDAALARHPAVAEAAVLAVGERTRQRLVAWVAFVDDETPDEEEWARTLTAHLESKLPSYMVPGIFHFAAALPLTSNGKIDRGALTERSEKSAATAEEQGYVEPRDEREKALAVIWTEVLGVERVGAFDNFFALGGDSVIGIRIVTRANEAGFALPPTALFEHHTVADLAASIDAREASSALVEMRGGDGLALFAVHAAGGNVFNYAVLAELLERPFYGLKARGYEAGEEPRQSIEEMAEAYLAALRQRRPEGPWALFGWSFGGFVAYEMACLLAEQGEEVAFLGILDTGAGRPEEDSPAERDVLIGMLAGLGTVDAEELGRRSDGEILALAARHVERAWGMAPGTGAEAVRRFLTIYLQSGRAWRAYEPRAFGGRLTLLRARDGAAPGAVDPDDPTLGWGALAAEVEVHEVPGDHGSVLRRPQVEELARVLGEILDKASRD